MPSSPPRAELPAQSHSQPLAPSPGESATQAAAVATRRRRRVGPDQRPGPLRLIVQAATPKPDTPQAAQLDMTRAQLADLAGQLASLQLVFDEIQRARELELFDPGWAANRTVLSQRADQIGRQLAGHRSKRG